ncbi:type II toxin-antitoxin system HipA family toxin [Nocardia thraciensis]
MAEREVLHGVWLGDKRVGVIHQRGDYSRFAFSEEYREDADRAVLGLVFEDEKLSKTHASALRLPPWFSNLLPEGRIREWVADDRGVSVDREMELLAHVGHDLPGAVRVMPFDVSPGEAEWNNPEQNLPATSIARSGDNPGWRMSLAGVQLKFSVLADQDRLTLPAFGEHGDWIVKLPDRQFADLPRNEFSMMSLASAAGIEVPDIRLVHRDLISGLPDNVWPGDEVWAYAIRRFDRSSHRELIHIEDLAQVRNVYPRDKYTGNLETVAGQIYRRRDLNSLLEFVRRLVFNILIDNGDAHLKNWSLVYHDPRRPTLSPAYDIVSTGVYRIGGEPEDLGLKLFGSKRFDLVTTDSFRRLQEKFGVTDADLALEAENTVTKVMAAWPRVVDEHLSGLPVLRKYLGEIIYDRSRSLLRSVRR